MAGAYYDLRFKALVLRSRQGSRVFIVESDLTCSCKYSAFGIILPLPASRGRQVIVVNGEALITFVSVETGEGTRASFRHIPRWVSQRFLKVHID